MHEKSTVSWNSTSLFEFLLIIAKKANNTIVVYCIVASNKNDFLGEHVYNRQPIQYSYYCYLIVAIVICSLSLLLTGILMHDNMGIGDDEKMRMQCLGLVLPSLL